MVFSKAWGGKTDTSQGKQGGRAQLPFISADWVSKNHPWQKVAIVFVKEGETKGGTEVLYIGYRQTDGSWLHRETYFSSKNLYPVLALFGIHDGIQEDKQLLGKTLFIKLETHTPPGYDRPFVRATDYRLEEPEEQVAAKLAEVPFHG